MKKNLLRLASISLALSMAMAACTAPDAVRPSPSPATPLPAVSESVTPAPAATATSAPSATPTPVLPPSTRLQSGTDQLALGNPDAAVAEFGALSALTDAPDIAREALLRLGQSQLAAGAYQDAAGTLQRYLQAYPEGSGAASAAYWLGQALAGLKDWAGAANAYRRYLAQRPLLATYVQERIGQALVQAGDQAGAAAAFRVAADTESAQSRKVDMIEEMARAQRAQKQYDAAVAAYDEILKLAQTAAYRSQIMFEVGATLRDAGRKDEAIARWKELLRLYPETTYAQRAIDEMDKLGAGPQDPLVRAMAAFAMGEYGDVATSLRAYAQADPEHGGAAHYYAGIAYRRLNEPLEAVKEWDLLIDTHPQSDLVPVAWYQKGDSLAQAGKIDEGVAVLRQTAASYPQQYGSAAVYRIAQLYDGAGRTSDAANAYAQAAHDYPEASGAADARFQAGFVYYLQDNATEAIRLWNAQLPAEADPQNRARLLLWLGKATAQDNAVGGRDLWAQAVAASPDSLWGLRARDLLAGHSFTGAASAGAFDAARYASRGDAAGAESWLNGWAAPAAQGQRLADVPQAVRDLPAYQRGMELWALGDTSKANTELRQVQTAFKDDARALFALALAYRDGGMYQASILAAQRVLKLAPEAAQKSPPRLLEELMYPTYYAGLVLPEAQKTNTDPLLFFSLVYQESVFDSGATSYADARGLAQVIPSTGEYIAGKLGETNYAAEHLWRPSVSVRYGLWYLSSALKMFNDDALWALVGYNAGPGNAAKWGEKAKGDDDIYFEVVSNWQPRAYMEHIYELRAQYEKLYR